MPTLSTQLIGQKLAGTDDEVGTVEDVYFDDQHLAVRYLVVKTGSWLKARHVLLSPRSLAADRTEGTLRVDLTLEQVRQAPPVDSDAPASRLYEQAHADFYGHPYYWSGPSIWGMGALPTRVPVEAMESGGIWPSSGNEEARAASAAAAEAARHSHLRSAAEITGYQAVARDDRAGRIDDLEIDEHDWRLTHLIVDTKPWWPGGRVAVPATAIERIVWDESEVRLNLEREAIKRCPPV